jgi:triosephosphate isomerase
MSSPPSFPSPPAGTDPGRPRRFFCGNWKLHGSLAESLALAEGVRDGLLEQRAADAAVAPGFVALHAVAQRLRGSRLGVAAQDCFWENKGAFTGEVGPQQIADAGAGYVIVGHSERRQFFGETDTGVARKAKGALACGLVPIICVGETLAERDAGQTLERIGVQLAAALEPQTGEETGRCVIAYEPVWAIGTGRNATPDEAADVHRFIRSRLGERLGIETARSIRILYGGSVKPDNIAALMGAPEIDGALVGGASLTVDSFVRIVKEGTSACTGS